MNYANFIQWYNHQWKGRLFDTCTCTQSCGQWVQTATVTQNQFHITHSFVCFNKEHSNQIRPLKIPSSLVLSLSLSSCSCQWHFSVSSCPHLTVACLRISSRYLTVASSATLMRPINCTDNNCPLSEIITAQNRVYSYENNQRSPHGRWPRATLYPFPPSPTQIDLKIDYGQMAQPMRADYSLSFSLSHPSLSLLLQVCPRAPP